MTEEESDYAAGDVVRLHTRVLGVQERTLTAVDAADLNAGENPLHPWAIDRIERVARTNDVKSR